MYNKYDYGDAEADAIRITESICNTYWDGFSESIRRAFRDSYERAYYAGYYRGIDSTRHGNERE